MISFFSPATKDCTHDRAGMNASSQMNRNTWRGFTAATLKWTHNQRSKPESSTKGSVPVRDFCPCWTLAIAFLADFGRMRRLGVRYVRITNSPAKITGMLIQACKHIHTYKGDICWVNSSNTAFWCVRNCACERCGYELYFCRQTLHLAPGLQQCYSEQTIFFFRATRNISRPDIIFAYRPRGCGAGRSSYAVRWKCVIEWYDGVKIQHVCRVDYVLALRKLYVRYGSYLVQNRQALESMSKIRRLIVHGIRVPHGPWWRFNHIDSRSRD